MNTQTTKTSYDRTRDLKAFDERKTGVKGLIDEVAREVPSIFVRPLEERSQDFSICHESITVPIIDLAHVKAEGGRKAEIVKEMLSASENWGFFQVVNHGIPTEVMSNMIDGIKMFHEQNDEIKKRFYSRDRNKVVTYNTNHDFYKSKAANWRDSLSVKTIFTGSYDPQDLPPVCREVMVEYINQVEKLGDVLLELISEALGLRPTYLKEEMECNRGWSLVNHYYPACPAPDLTLGTSKHSDPSFLTILLQDQIGGLQVLHDNHWVNVMPIPGAFVINIGDILQIVSNDKLKSVHHRVTANSVGPRISVALFMKGVQTSPKLYGPIKELLSEDNPPVYREFTLREFHTNFFNRPLDVPGFEHFKVVDHQVAK